MDPRLPIESDTVLDLLKARPDVRLLAIGGLPVSGKSTLADRLETELGAQIVYLDDFVRPPSEWRGSVKPAFPFPYIRYDAFMAAVATLARGEAARYQRYDWTTERLAADWREVVPAGLIVIEGVSALHPALAPFYDLRLWIDSDAATTLDASLERGVGDWEQDWRDLFMPSVALYLATDPQRRADLLVKGRGATGA